ncbi:ABC transporter ATP-binding protein [Actinokineospora diospyrosa]|uniref:ABC-type multidrug transport system, ATPase and permease component n=1 Tax=Actinokineospora diospyrosa TaxID=103728 RepID=A0ABT1IGX1_9PSEU|nr:ABC transporter ATP-binding protein [Actinokineospora diospyrosa]MCP2271806.1 ABC-type multidrug transport system, ATPase and permease component [Actinokineospora diospyrosa]
MSTVSDEQWRGVAAEDTEELDRQVGLKLKRRSRALLGTLLRPHLRWAVIGLVLVFLENAARLAGPLLIAVVIDTGIPNAIRGDTTVMAWCVVAYAFCSVASAGLWATFLNISGRIGQDLVLDLRQRMFRHSQRLSLSFHEHYTSGKVISRQTSDIDSFTDLLEVGIDDLLTSVLSIVGITILLLTLDLDLAALTLATALPLFFVTRWFLRRSNQAYRGVSGRTATVIVHYVETMNGMRAVQAYRREDRNRSIMDGLNTRLRSAARDSLDVVATFTMSVRMVGNLSLAVVLAFGAFRVADGTLELGVLTAFTLYLRRFYEPLDDIAMFANSYSSAIAALEKISGLLEEEPDVREPKQPKPLPPHRGGLPIEFTGTEFRYRPDTPIVLTSLDLTIPAGQTVALVGPTGAGKSTIAKLVARFYDPTGGTVQLAGVDIRDVSDVELRGSVVMVTQENFLFSGSVADNILLGKPDATRTEVESAARAVGAHDFITALPQGYDTDVRKRGGRLSAGQRQVIAFARAFLANPAVLVLDEATSSLDLPTERVVQRALESVLADRTALIIAHRLSTVLIADRVLVVTNGQITEDGHPQDLITGEGHFAALHTAWRDSLA